MPNTYASSECSRRVEPCNSRLNAGCQLLATIDVALEIRRGQRVLPPHVHHDVQVRHGCKHQCLLASSIGACGMLQHCATNAQQVADVQDVHDEQLQQRDGR